MVQVLAYRFFSGIFDGFTVTAGDPIQRYWARVHPLNESLFSVIGLVVFSVALYVTKSIGLGWSWHRVIAWTTVSVIVLDAIVGMLTIWDVLRSQWFWLGTPILEELPQAMNFLVSTFVVVELAELGNEAAVYGLLTTVSNLSSPFASCISKNVNALFDVGVADIIRDSKHGLLAHIEVVKPENEITEARLVSDAKALGIIAQGVELQHQTKIRFATRALQAWITLREFYNRSTLHNRVTLTRRLHEFKMENGSTMSKH
ncbi:hypothetical protein PPTG_24310 [Phytophthora nicotianae INRA-310]|uniref:Uncharacterized protein n=1 Tax=Phytophthora nicotianae (strain INRA-310) TaxID=761204 RepID=W2PJ89_PHYN3|nr:hypothetical protein PPTG_24310 [Phytophthora nicotianae INRA-310]ETN00095.1 hypothetical protein PPTG_24310 [Phytophthora nicotianae INRA-310]